MQKQTDVLGRSTRLAPYVAVALTLIGGVLRALALDGKGLWLDEAFSVWLANRSLLEMLAWLLRVDQHPPLYYALLHFWVALFGDSASSVRMPSVLFGTLTIPVVYLLGRRLLGTTGGLLAAAILTVSPFHVRFAQEARMYTLLALNASLAMLCLACILTDPRAATDPPGSQFVAYLRSRREGQRNTIGSAATDLAWIGLIVFTVAAALSHNTAVLFPLAINVFVLGFIFRRRRSSAVSHSQAAAFPAQLNPPSLRNWLAAQAVTFLLWSPWLAAFVIQTAKVYGEFWIQRPTPATIAATLGSFFSAHLPARMALIAPAALIFGALLILGVAYLRRSRALLGLLLVLIVTPFAGELLVSLKRPIFYDRTLIWTTIPLFLLLAAGLLQLKYRPVMLVGLAAIVAINAFSLHQYYTRFEKEQWREAAAYVAQQVQEGELLLFNAAWVQIPFDFYFKDFNRQVEERGVPVDLFDRGILEPKMARSDLPRLRELIRNRDRVWLIYSHNWYTDPQNLIPSALGAELELLEQRPFFGLDVRLYGKPR